MKKTVWIAGTILLAAAAFGFVVMTVLGAAGTVSTAAVDEDDTLSGSDATLLARKACELYCFAVYYTDKALAADPQSTTYEAWQRNVNTAQEYWDAMEQATIKLEDSVTDDTFEAMFDSRCTVGFSLFRSAYALDSAEILQVFDSAPAGQRLRTLAEHLGSDMSYARAALKVANGQITADSWNSFGDTAQTLEGAARGLRSAGKVAATAAGLIASGGVSGVLEVGALTVSGADTLMQIADDAAFIAMGDKYDSDAFVAALNKTQNTWSQVSGPVDILFGDMNDPMDATMFMLNTADNVRSLLQEGKYIGYDLKALLGGGDAAVTIADSDEIAQAMQADADGGDVPDEIAQIIDILEQQTGDGDDDVSDVPIETAEQDIDDMPVETQAATEQPESMLPEQIIGTWEIVWNIEPTAFGQPLNVSEGFDQEWTLVIEETYYEEICGHAELIRRYKESGEYRQQALGNIYYNEEGIFIDWYSGGLSGYEYKLLIHENGYLYMEIYNDGVFSNYHNAVGTVRTPYSE